MELRVLKYFLAVAREENITKAALLHLTQPTLSRRIMDTFLEHYDFEGVTIVPFCTSGSSGIDGSLSVLRAFAPGATWLDGQRFSGGTSQDAVAAWMAGLDFPASPSMET